MKKLAEARKTVIIFLDTDKHTSPFDILTAIELFPEAQILKYSPVEPEEAKRLIQDAMFPRGPEGAKYTKIFIGGYDVDKALKILEIAKPGQRILVAPFGSGAGADAYSIIVTDKIEERKNLAPTVEDYLNRKVYIDYSTYLKFRNMIHRIR